MGKKKLVGKEIYRRVRRKEVKQIIFNKIKSNHNINNKNKCHRSCKTEKGADQYRGGHRTLGHLWKTT